MNKSEDCIKTKDTHMNLLEKSIKNLIEKAKTTVNNVQRLKNQLGPGELCEGTTEKQVMTDTKKPTSRVEEFETDIDIISEHFNEINRIVSAIECIIGR